jgi:monovalent cation:H+ antiporter-2, CPA2 family
MVLVLMLLPAFAGALGGQAPGHGSAPQSAHAGSILAIVGLTLAKVAAFFAVMLLAGKRILRWVLKRVEQVGSDELLVTALGAIALGVAYRAVRYRCDGHRLVRSGRSERKTGLDGRGCR